MKNYIKRVHDNSKRWENVFWWLFRLPMIYAFIDGFFPAEGEAFDITNPLQVFANLSGMFAWEIFMALPKKNLLRQVPSYVQNISVILLFLASFGGKYLNLYYDLQLWDSALHLVGGGLGVIGGYEIVCCMQKRDKSTANLKIILLCAFGYSFIVSTGWELFEFIFDQIACAGGGIGDAQHWCFALAEGTPKEATIIPPVYPERWPIMDTMIDIVLNTVGAVIVYITLRFVPYHHRGENDLNKIYAVKAEEKETVSVK